MELSEGAYTAIVRELEVVRAAASSAHTNLSSHEVDCERRYGEIKEGLGGVKRALGNVAWAAASAAVALIAWMAVLIWPPGGGSAQQESPTVSQTR